jgi:hypothetical protein
LNYDKELIFEEDDEEDETEEDETEEDNHKDTEEDETEKETLQDLNLQELTNEIDIKKKLKDISNEQLCTIKIGKNKITDKHLLDVLKGDEYNKIKIKPFLIKSMYREMELRHFLKALNEIRVGIEKKEKTMTDDEKKRVSYHEAGHALIAYLFKSTNPPIKITIIPHGEGSLGFTMTEPDDRKMHLRSELLAQVAVLLGGTIAERVFFGEPGTGASDDLKRATNLLNNYICRFGMDDQFGLVSFDMDDKEVPTQWKNKVYQITNKILFTLKTQVKKAIEENKSHMKSIAEYLLENEEILEENVRNILPKEIENTLTINLEDDNEFDISEFTGFNYGN